MFLCFSFLAWMLSLLVYMGLCCVSVGSSLPRCCPYLASMLGLCWICHHDPGSWLGLCLCWICLCWASMLVYVEIRRPRSEIRGPRPEVRGPRSEVRGPRSEVRGPRSEIRGPRSEVRGPRSEVRGSRSEVRGKGLIW